RPWGVPSCGASIEVRETFYGGCGAALTIGERAATQSQSMRRSSPRRFARQKPRSRASASRSPSLFANVKGSLEPAEQLDPEAWSRIIQRFFRILLAWIIHEPSR